MHEFSIIQNIIEIVTETAVQNHVKQIYAVELEVGAASGVVKQAMEFAWEAAGKGELLKNSLLKISEVPLSVKCTICRNIYSPAEIYESCPACGEVSPEIISGKELRILAIETV
jgi:hydrogenase nickel incorporation protein HypA/HybF